jgi:UPF0716 protein FxsA
VAVLLVLIFIVLPVAEIYVIIKVGEAIGVLPTIALLILDGILGAALLRAQGRAAWRRFNEALAAGKVPAREVLGLLLLLPPSRAMFRGLVTRVGLGRAAFAVRTVQWGSKARGRYRQRGGPPRSYDYEGSAREVNDKERQLPRPSGDGDA